MSHGAMLAIMPESERDTSYDSSEECPWDSDRDLPEWIDGVDDAAISGTKDVE